MRFQTENPAERLPKPMASLDGRPLLWHIMKYYSYFGHRQFGLCLGHHGATIQDYFKGREFADDGWEIEFLDTGLDSSIGERFAQTQAYVGDDEVFLASYGDTLTDAPLPQLIETHAASGKVASLLATKPNYTFNVIQADASHLVTGFADVAETGMWINGGFFVLRRGVFDYIQEGDDLPETLARLIADRELLAYEYDGFWAPMDTLKDKHNLEALAASGRGPWEVWSEEQNLLAPEPA
jgi:glucose-1-phosphate cytidylyltransferase